jgi:hypothetical protein
VVVYFSVKYILSMSEFSASNFLEISCEEVKALGAVFEMGR